MTTRHEMKTWLRLTLITVSIGGGFTGLAGTASVVTDADSTASRALVGVALALWTFVIVSGLMFVNNSQKTTMLLWSLLLQVPHISTSYLAYRFGAGFAWFLDLAAPENIGTMGLRIASEMRFGATWKLGSSDGPLRIGANLAALFLAAMTWRAVRNQRENAEPSCTSGPQMPPEKTLYNAEAMEQTAG